MTIVTQPITLAALKQMATSRFGNLVKAVVDVQKRIMALDAELHADEEAALLARGSRQEDLWGINLYPELFGKGDFVEFDSMINLRPSMGNASRGIDSAQIRQTIGTIVSSLIQI